MVSRARVQNARDENASVDTPGRFAQMERESTTRDRFLGGLVGRRKGSLDQVVLGRAA
jgi:hypothetical protein